MSKNFMSAATRIRTVYISLIRGEESHRLAECTARWLQDDDLLAPDLPDPVADHGDWQRWGTHPLRVEAEQGEVTATISGDGDPYHVFTPDEARKYAHWLLAAANYAEGANHDD